MKKRMIVFLLSGLLILLSAASLSCLAAEEEAPSLTLHCTVGDNGSERPIAGDTFAAVKVADCTVLQAQPTPILTYAAVGRFAAYDCDWTHLSASEMRDKAEALSAVVGAEDCVDTQTTDAEGTARFTLADAGMYLIVRTKASDTDITFEPLLISVPQPDQEGLLYAVTASPKFGDKHITPVTPHDGDSLPQTGQIFWPIVLFAAAGVPMIAAGVLLIRSGKKHEEDQ